MPACQFEDGGNMFLQNIEYNLSELHGVITQKTGFFVAKAVRISLEKLFFPLLPTSQCSSVSFHSLR
jgi:hypothetical protein